MKILQLIPYFYPAFSYGGSLRAAYELSKELVKRGHKVTVYTSDSLDAGHRVKVPDAGYAVIDGIKVHYFKNVSNWLAGHYKFFLAPAKGRAIAKKLREFDIVHLYEYRAFQEIPVLYYARKYSIPYVVQTEGAIPRIITKQRLKKLFDLLWGYKLLRNASKAIAVTQTEAEQYKSMGVSEDKIAIVPNGIDFSPFKELPKYGQFRDSFGIKEKHIILYLGRIHKRKGIDFLVKSFSGLIEEIPDAILIIAGPDDGYKGEIEKLVKGLNLEEKVMFTGHLDGEDKLSAYVDADVLAYPAIWEIFGLVPFEGLMCGTPVIVADDCGCGEIVREADAGLLVKYGDIDALKNAIIKILAEPTNAKAMAHRGKEYVLRNLGWEHIAAEMEKVYQEAIGEL